MKDNHKLIYRQGKFILHYVYALFIFSSLVQTVD